MEVCGIFNRIMEVFGIFDRIMEELIYLICRLCHNKVSPIGQVSGCFMVLILEGSLELDST